MDDWLPLTVALIGSAGMILTGFVALRKSPVEVGSVLVDSAAKVVEMMNAQAERDDARMRAMEAAAEDRDRRLAAGEADIALLKQTVGSWESWAERVLDLLDRSVGLLGEEARARLQADVEAVRRERPAHAHAEHIVKRESPPGDPEQEGQMDRFLKYTSGREPVITINLVAAILFGVVVTVAERAGVTLSESELMLMGAGFLAVATWLARRGVFSPDTHAADVTAALYTPVPTAAPPAPGEQP